MSRHHVGQRVNVTAGPFAGARGRVTRATDAEAGPQVDWCVRFDQPVTVGERVYAAGAVAEGELAAYSVPESARPVSVGALAGGVR